MRRRLTTIMGIVLSLCVIAICSAEAQIAQLPPLQIGINTPGASGQLTIPIQILLVLTVLTFMPALLITMTSFIRIIIVLSLLRQALGVQQMPPNQVLIGLALFLSFFIMKPVGHTINIEALQPYINKNINIEVAIEKAVEPIKKFMLHQTSEKDLGLFIRIANQPRPRTPEDITLTSLIPAFVISELKTAFQIGFLLYMPFLILDLVVSSILLSIGMMMLPPVLISLPFKLILFVLVDGWHLVIGSLVHSFL